MQKYAWICALYSLLPVHSVLHWRYTSAAKIGEEILITAQILKQGRNIAFATVDLTNKATGKLVAQGRHTKFLGN